MGNGNKRNLKCECGSGKKYKHCHMDKDDKKSKLKERMVTITRKDFISAPYQKCPNIDCLKDNSFGVSFLIGGSSNYTRECFECGFKQNYKLPSIKKKVIYLDQFVISNLIKLLDKSHPSHKQIKDDPFWTNLFIKLETASKSQAIVCPDSFYHKDESYFGNIDYRLAQRLYEHFSSGKTLDPSFIIQKNNIIKHFKNWIIGKKTIFEYNPQDISSENLHTWSAGMMISIRNKPYPGQLENLQKVNLNTKNQLMEVWERWKVEDVSFTERVKEETLGLGKGLLKAIETFISKRDLTISNYVLGGEISIDNIDDIISPPAVDLIEDLFDILKSSGFSAVETKDIILKYFSDTDSLLEIPQIKISSVIFAGLANLARNGKNNPPKSTVDSQFISSYLPYCDALFVDKESFVLLTKLPKDTPKKLRLDEFSAKIFSLNNKQDFLDYLDNLVKEIPTEQIEVLKDMKGDDYAEPYWTIIENEKRDLV